MQKNLLCPLLLTAPLCGFSQERPLPRNIGLKIGVISPGRVNAITDVSGVKVGQETLIKGDSVRTGVTAIIPHSGNTFQMKVPAAIFSGNGFGKLAGSTQVQDPGNLETPIILTKTLAVAPAMERLIDHTLSQPGNESVQSVNALVGETNDSYLNDIRSRHVSRADVLSAIAAIEATEEAIINSLFAASATSGRASRNVEALLLDKVIPILKKYKRL